MPTPDTAHTPLTSTSLHPPSYRGWLNLQAIAEGQSTSDAARAHAEDCKAQAPAGGEGLGGLKGAQTTVAAPFNRTAGERDDLGDCTRQAAWRFIDEPTMTNSPTPDDVQNATPPPFEAANIIQLVSVDNSRITNVSLYAGRAEITRLYKFEVKTGENQVIITGLPNTLDSDSIRVDGRGSATIHDVTVSENSKPATPSTSDLLEKLSDESNLVYKTLDRAKAAKKSLEAYLDTLHVQHADVATVDTVLEHYESRGEALDKKILALQNKLTELLKQIDNERAKLSDASQSSKLGAGVTISLFAASEGEVSIVLAYAVESATWKAAYDIRVEVEKKESLVTLLYKAGITQDTGESWDDVPLSLETASPTFGMNIPVLSQWTLDVPRTQYKAKSKMRLSSLVSSVESPQMEHRRATVISKRGVTATYQVPGRITIPSDGKAHSVTVTKLYLHTDMSWVAVPRADSKVHLQAKIVNASEYTLLPGVANIYVNDSFISKSEVPLVSPHEPFDCPLGLDPSVRITYHPLLKKVTHSSGFYSKSSTYACTQSITVTNTKLTPIFLKVHDQLPISNHSQIVIKYHSPGLTPPVESGSSLTNKASADADTDGGIPRPLKVSEHVKVQWEGADEADVTPELLGVDGRFYWMCHVPPQGKINLVAAWEATAPLRTQIDGL
ncbi:hypothetical protein H0H92_006658 [Tricholoma furcatifolium]|nr:hypothetical protein H0H92_006658 [Tricholoma furcatifolium]